MPADQPERPRIPGLNRQAKKQPRKTKASLQKIERHARWIVREWERSPTYSYNEMIAAVRERFAVGITSAEQAYARSREMFAEAFQELDLSWFVAQYKRLYERALHDGKLVAAARILESMAINSGVAAPTKIALGIGTVADLEKMSDEELADHAQLSVDVLSRAQVLALPSAAPIAEPVEFNGRKSG